MNLSTEVTLSRIVVYPIKSLDGVALSESRVLANGALEFDRRFALVDAEGRILNAKKTAAVHPIRAEFDLPNRQVRLSRPNTRGDSRFHWDTDRTALEDWFSESFQQPVRLIENEDGGFPDDPDAPGPTIVSERSLRAIGDWFDGMEIDEVRRRFRANLELKTPVAFWEDRLFAEADKPVAFRIGTVRWFGTNPCQRCVVPSRDPETGSVELGFQAKFAAHREASLPEWASRSRFNHFYRFAVNTRGDGSGVIRVGDLIELC